MKYIILSDIHDNFNNLQIALNFALKKGIKHGFVLGDLINDGIMHKLGKSDINFDIVLGNHDGDKFMLTKVSLEYANINLADLFIEKKANGKKIFLIHNEKLGALVAKSGEYDVVFCGNDHKYNLQNFGKTLLINPGEITGHMYGMSTFVVWESDSNKVEFFHLKEGWIDVKVYKRNGDEALDKIQIVKIDI